MPDKPITLDEIRRAQKHGTEFQFDQDVLQIERFGELIDALKTMASNEAERIRADISRNQTNLEIMGSLQNMIKKAGQGPSPVPMDLTPIRDLLEEMRADRHHEPVDYDFNILRAGPGLSPAVKIEARAITPTKH